MVDQWADVDDDVLLTRRRGGDATAFVPLYRRHIAEVSNYARHLCPRHIEPEDVVAEALHNTVRAVSNGRGPIDGFRRYLFIAVRNTVIQTVASRGEPTAGLEDERAEQMLDPVPPPETVDLDEPLFAAFAGLPARWRDLLWLLEVEGWSAAEVAAWWRSTPRAISAMAYRSRRRLRHDYVALVGARQSMAGPAIGALGGQAAPLPSLELVPEPVGR